MIALGVTPLLLALPPAASSSTAPSTEAGWTTDDTEAPAWPGPDVLVSKTERTRRMRGDFETADAVVVTFTPDLESSLVEVVAAIISETPVLGLIPNDASQAEILETLRAHGVPPDRIELIGANVDSAWVRDYGPLQVIDRRDNLVWLDADYSWRRNDDVVPQQLAKLFGMRLETIPEPLEGGAVISNGRGLCVSTRDFFVLTSLSLDDPDARESFLQQIGCSALALVPALANEPTRHVDLLAQFMTPTTLALASFDPDEAPDNARLMDEAERILITAAASQGTRLTVHRIPHAPPDGEKYYSYLNGLRLRHRFLAPSYGAVDADAEETAMRALQRALPDGVVIDPIPSDAMVALNGAIHCLTLGITLPRRIGRISNVAFVAAPAKARSRAQHNAKIAKRYVVARARSTKNKRRLGRGDQPNDPADTARR